jgi:hypothetical protein
MTIMPPARKKVKPAAQLTLRCSITFGGTVAVSGISVSTRQKPIARTPKRTSRAMIRPSFQAYVEPPHCRAKRRQTTDGTRHRTPRGSKLRICSLIGDFFFCSCFGGVQTNNIRIHETAPMGRLIQKHHLGLHITVSSGSVSK